MSAALSGSKGDPRISIAVLDGPIDRDHPCFTGTRLSFPLGQPDINASSAAAAHGTHVASIIFGNGGGIDGIAPDCRGIIVPVFTDGPEGLRCSQLQLARAILAAVDGGAHIINVSGGEAAQAADPFLVDALAKCEQAGVLVVAAAGNDGQALVHMPAGVPTVLAVGASDWSGGPREFSNFGAAYGSHGLIAPGENINGALPGGGAAQWHELCHAGRQRNRSEDDGGATSTRGGAERPGRPNCAAEYRRRLRGYRSRAVPVRTHQPGFR